MKTEKADIIIILILVVVAIIVICQMAELGRMRDELQDLKEDFEVHENFSTQKWDAQISINNNTAIIDTILMKRILS